MTTRAAHPETFRRDQGITAYGTTRSTAKGAPIAIAILTTRSYLSALCISRFAGSREQRAYEVPIAPRAIHSQRANESKPALHIS